jgi:hypothetical protein
VREAVAFLLLACACGAATVRGRAEDARRDERRGDAPTVAALGAPDDHGFAALEGRATVLAPGLKQAAERESAGERVELVRAGNDTCVRVAFEASAPVTARLQDADGGLLAQTSSAATEGALGDRGPVCVRKGDAVSASADGVDPGAATRRVRWIAWASR